MRLQSWFFLTAWLAGTLALPGAYPATLSTVPTPAQTPTGDCSQSGLMCIAEMHVVYNQTTGTCGCEWIPGFGPAVIVTERQYVDPSTCPTIKCTSTTRPVYHPETESCSCDPIAPECPNVIFCAAGSHKVQDTLTKKCACQVTNPIPPTCPQFKCLENTHVVYNPETDQCGCVPDCPDLMCIAEQRVTYDSATNSCSCIYIPGLEPSPIQARAADTYPAPTRAIPPPACSEIMCISQKYPVYDEITGLCNCEWSPGLEPSTPIR